MSARHLWACLRLRTWAAQPRRVGIGCSPREWRKWANLLGLVALIFALGPTLALGQASFGSATSFNAGWTFALQDDPASKDAAFDDRTWEKLNLPHDWSIQAVPSEKLASCTGYLPGGVGWYRKKVVIPAAGGPRVFLYFQGIYTHSEVYVNGHLLGKRPNGYVPLMYDATPYVRFDEENTVAVRVDHSRSADSRWYTGSGIYRNVFLVRANDVHVAPFGVFAHTEQADSSTARVRVETEIQNESSRPTEIVLRHELVTAEGTVIATSEAKLSIPESSQATQADLLAVEQPRLWSLDHPQLYHLRTTVSVAGNVVDQTENRIGIRMYSFDANRGFALNGQSTKMKGVCLHDDAGVLGNAVPRLVWRKRLEALKSIGCNAVRMSHNPHAPEVYELCDELGLLVLDEAFDEWEFPKRKWLRGWNVGEAGFEGPADYFAEWAERDIAAMVRQNRNHPAIFAWSIGNEVDYPNDPYSHPILERARIDQPMLPGYKPQAPDAMRLGVIAQRLSAAVRKHDATRPVTAALAGVVMSNETAYPSALDIVGYNYTEDRYALDHQKYPQRIIYGSENRHSASAWRAVADNDYIFGQFLWTGIDYLGEAGPWPSRGSTAGLLDLTGAVKPRGRFRQALWSPEPAIYLGTELAKRSEHPSIDAWPRWNYTAGETVRVLCYTNAANARLLLNGKAVEDPKPNDRETGVISWEIPYEPGRLEVIGANAQGENVCRHAIESAGAPAALKVTTDETLLGADRGVAVITIQVVDRKGAPVLTADPEIACRISGSARLLGLEASDNRDMTAATSTSRRAFRGRLVAYLEASGESGPVQVTFTTSDLPATTLTLRVH